VIYTEWELPSEAEQPHDVITDSKGLVWYADFGSQLLGVLDPKTGRITQYKPPNLKPNRPGGSLSLQFDKDENLWLAMMWQGGIAKFDRKTSKFQTWSLPAERQGDFVQLTFLSPQHSDVDHKVWVNDSGTYVQYRLDTVTGKWDVFETSKSPRPGVYDVISDAQNNLYFYVIAKEHIGKIDAKSGQVSFFEIPTKNAGPRRGMIDTHGRLWFGENHSDRFGMFDPNTQTFREWDPPTKGSWPYDTVSDKNGVTWVGGEFTDRVIRLDTKTNELTEFLLPRKTNVRRLWTDKTSNPALWIGNTHEASIVKVETLTAATQGVKENR
jgi:streptogramin lyase